MIENRDSDVKKSRFSHIEWSRAAESTTNTLENFLKETFVIFSFEGFLFTYNSEGCFSQSRIATLFELQLH